MKKEIQVSNEREPTEEMVLAGIAAANRTMPYVSDAQCVAAIWKAMQAANSKAMPQGLEEWVERNKLLSLDAAVEFVVTVEDLRAYLSGMAIVPVEFIDVLQNSPEINPSNYTHEQVCQLNTAVCEALAMLSAAKDALECTGCGWSGTKAEYRAQMKAGGFLACCPESNLLAAAKEKNDE